MWFLGVGVIALVTYSMRLGFGEFLILVAVFTGVRFLIRQFQGARADVPALSRPVSKLASAALVFSILGFVLVIIVFAFAASLGATL